MFAKKKEKNYEMQVSIMFVSYMDEVSSRGRNRFGGKGWCTYYFLVNLHMLGRMMPMLNTHIGHVASFIFRCTLGL